MEKATTLILDFDVYPRHSINSTNVSMLVHALEAGTVLPPVIVDRASRRVVDGFHRVTAAIKRHGDEAELEVEWREYADEGALLLEAIQLNAGHGQRLSSFDAARCTTLAESLDIAPEQLAAALSITGRRLSELSIRKMAVGPDARPLPIKRTLSHLAQKTLTPGQVEGNRIAGGQSQRFYVDQVVALVEHNTLESENQPLMARLAHLQELLRQVFEAAA